MLNLDELRENLRRRGIALTWFDSGEEAAAYLDGAIDGTTVGLGGSVTLQEIGLPVLLKSHNQVYSSWRVTDPDLRKEIQAEAAKAAVYVSSVNALTEKGEIVNIDGTSNRTSALQFGPERVYLVVGVNKLTPDYDAALWRARNIAAPQNARRLGRSTPCAAKADRCYDCTSPERICRTLSVLWEKPGGVGTMEVVLVNRELGY